MNKEKIPIMKYCPNCGSPNVDWVLPQTWSRWRCRDCGYEGALVVEDGELASEIRKRYLERRSKE